MVDDKEKLISYSPDLHYQDEYISDYQEDVKEESIQVDDGKTDIEDLIDKGDSLSELVDKLPGGLSDIVGEILDQVNDFVQNELEGESLERVPVELEWDFELDTDPTGPEGEGDRDDIIDDEEAFWEADDYVKIEKEFHTKEEIFQKEYIKNIYDLFEDYYTNLHTIVSNYWTNLLLSTYGKENSEIKLILENIILSKEDVIESMLHLLDSVVRTEKIRCAKLNYFMNNFNAEETIKHIKQFQIIQELRLKYARIETVNPKTDAERMSNGVLEGMLLTYDKKYDKAYENLYRYLNSSNIILKDAFGVLIQELKIKQTLVERDGIK